MSRKIKNKVLYCLKKYPQSRNNDEVLYYCILWDFYHDAYIEYEPGKWAIKTDALYSLPSASSVRRARQYIQNTENLFLPTDKSILKKRKQTQKYVQENIMKGIDVYDKM